MIYTEVVPAFWRLTVREGRNEEVEQNWGWNSEHLTRCMGDSRDRPSLQEGAVWGYRVLPTVGDTRGGLGGCEIPN